MPDPTVEEIRERCPLNPLEQSMYDRHTTDLGHTAYLVIDHQTFTVCEDRTPPEVEWYRRQLAKALARLVRPYDEAVSDAITAARSLHAKEGTPNDIDASNAAMSVAAPLMAIKLAALPICEECDEEMHPFDDPNSGKSGYSCDNCGWSFDNE